MADDALETIRLRNDFYRHNYRRLVFALLLSIIALMMLVSGLVYFVANPPAPRYFATSTDGRITALVPLTTPNLSNAALLQWATGASVGAFSYNFVNYREALQNLRDNFTENGWRGFVDALRNSNNLDAVREKKLVISAVPTGTPVILEQGLMAGRYTWKVQLPLLVTYQSASDMISQPVTITLLIVRISTLQSVKGIGISQFIMAGSGSIRG